MLYPQDIAMLNVICKKKKKKKKIFSLFDYIYIEMNLISDFVLGLS